MPSGPRASPVEQCPTGKDAEREIMNGACGVEWSDESGRDGWDRPREREDHARPKTRTNFPPRCDLKIRRLSVRMRRDAAAKKVRFMDHPACLRRVRPCLYSTTCRRSPAFCSDGRKGGRRTASATAWQGKAGKRRTTAFVGGGGGRGTGA